MSDLPEMDIYARKSSVLAEGHRLREVSTDEQVKQGYAWAARNGYRVRTVWVELGSAYAEKKRPKFIKAVDAVVSGDVSVLWTYMLDRFTRRGAEDVLLILGKGRVIFDYDRLDSADPRDRERIVTEAERARGYSERLSHRVRDVKAGLRDQGVWGGGPVPWGLRLNPDTRQVEPDPQPAGGYSGLTRAQKGREMGLRLMGGEASRAVCRSFNTMLIPSARGGSWAPVTMIKTVLSPAYAGLQPSRLAGDHDGRYRNEHGHTVSVGTGLFTPEEQDAIRVALNRTPDAEKPPNQPARGGRGKHLLTKLLYCSTVTEKHPPHGMCVQGHSYACNRASTAGHAHPCPQPANLKREPLERYVSEKWLHVVGALEPTDPLAHVIAERWAALQAPEKTAEHREAESEVKAAENVRLRLQKAFRAGAYEGAEDMFSAEMRRTTKAVQEARENLSRHQAPVPDLGFIDDPMVLREAWEAAPLSRKRELLALAIDRIWVSKAPYNGAPFKPEERVVIEWAETA